MDWLPAISEAAGPLYRQISDAIERDISSGRLRRGQQLPTHRALANGLGVDLTTVTRAYSDARRRGLLDARVGQGTFVSESTARSAADIPDPVNIDLSMNVPPQPVEAGLDSRIMQGLAAVHQRAGLSSVLNYQQPGGSEQERHAASAWLRARMASVSAARLLVYPGSQTAIFNILLSLLKPGDVLLTEALTFPGCRVAAQALGIVLAGVASDSQGVLPEALAKAIRARKPKAVYLMPTMQNPTTATMGKARRGEIAEILRRARLPLIEDDAYGALDPSHHPLADLIPEQTYLTVSLSKCLMPALRVSFLMAPDAPSVMTLCRSLHASSQMAPPLMVALVTEWLASGEADRIVSAIRNEAKGRQQLAARILNGLTFAAHPNGHHIWLTLPARWNRAEFVAELFKQGLAVVGSEAFATDQGEPAAVRLCLGAARNRAELATALNLLRRTFDRAGGLTQVV